ncbi:MAG: hypothetical protein KDN18_12005 [Verrucomicrobiae bacterium]|nr:hypothetical protein [Verrucomicrobiae bacterium]
MNTRFSNSCRWISGLALLLFALSIPLSAAAAGRSAKKPSTIYVIRGGGGYFPNLGTVINEKFEAQGLEVVDFRYHERGAAAKKIAAAYRAKELPGGIILIGYSLGGCGVIEVSRELQKQEIPVRLLFLIETINPLQTVPANVQECFNLYHFPAILGAPVKADSPQTKLTNFEAYTDAGLGLEYSHFAMPFVEEVHELIASRLVAAINSKPPKSTPPTTKPVPQKMEKEKPASGTEPEKKPLFSGLFSKAAPKENDQTAEKSSSDKPKSGR